MKRFMAVMCVMTVVAVCAGVAQADGIKQGAVTLSPSAGGYRFDNNKELNNDGRMYNLGIGYNFTRNIAAEANFSLLDTDADSCNCRDNNLKVYFPRVEALYHFMPDSRFVPYLAVGGGYQFYRFDDDKNLKKQVDDGVVVDYGLGVKFFLTENFALRGDARHFYDTKNSSNDFAVTLGVLFQFGGEDKKPAKVVEKAPEPVKKAPMKPETKMDKEPAAMQPPVKVADKKLPPAPPAREERVEATVLFEFDKSVVRHQYREQLKKVADFMKANPSATASVSGYTDSIGMDNYNLKLSDRRAQSVKDYLVKNFGIDPSRITTKGFGEAGPVGDNKTESGRKLNRHAVTISIAK